MKTTVVPAQITSVEDKIAGNLSFTQLLLLIIPVFIGAGLFVFLPPFAGFKIYKVIIASIIAIICSSLAIRIKGKLVLEWLLIRSRYNKRPRFYVFNKNDKSVRQILPHEKRQEAQTPEPKRHFKPVEQLSFKTKEIYVFETAIKQPAADFHFSVAKKGGLRVHIKEVE